MTTRFPFGLAPLMILLVAVVTGAGVWLTHGRYGHVEADLVVATHARLHADIYRAKLPIFEKKYGVKVKVQEIEESALRSRLLAAFAAGTEVPDVVEIPQNPAYFLRGPIKDIGFLDLTDWVHETGLDERLVASRFSLWRRKGVIFGLPHDVHPVMLAYRADIVEGELGIDVTTIKTWADFVAMAQMISRDQNGDGQPDRYALELATDGGDMLSMLMLQRGVDLFDAEDRVVFDQPAAVDVVMWYLRALYGPERFGYGLGFGQALWQGMSDGLVLFYMTPDWRTRTSEQYAPGLAGKMKVMPLPAWEPGGRRTTTWGATGGAVTKRSRNPELARELLAFLYADQTDGGKSAAELHILPPSRDAWTSAEFDRTYPFYSDQPIMRLYAELADEVPPSFATPFTEKARGKRNEAFINCGAYYREHGEEGLREFVAAELKRQADVVRALMARTIITEQ